MTTTPTRWLAPLQANSTDTVLDPTLGLLSGQFGARVVGLANGGYLVTWADDTNTRGFGLGPNDLGAQLFSATGQPLGSEFSANAMYNDYDQGSQEVIALAGGGFAVAYHSEDAAMAGDLYNINVDIFDENGDYVRSDDFRQGFAGTPGLDDTNPAIATLSGSNYVIAYEQTDGNYDNIVGHVVVNGVIGPQFVIEGTGEASRNPDVAALSNGSFVVAYEVDNTPGNATHIRAQVRTETGVLVTDVLIGSMGAGTTHQPSLVALQGGNFVMVWEQAGANGAVIKVGIYNANAVLVSGFDSTTFATTTGSQTSPDVTALADGGFIVVWYETETGAIRGQRFDANGAEIGTEFIAAASASPLSDPDITTLADGRILISYTADAGGGDTDVFTTIWDPRTGPLIGTANRDVVTSRVEGATVNGLGGNDDLLGAAGNDILDGGAGADLLSGGLGSDRASYVSAAAGVVASLSNPAANTGDAAGDIYSSIESLTGSNFNDTLTGSNAANSIIGGAGNDVVTGLGGADSLSGGDGNDTLIGGVGGDYLSGGAGSDRASYAEAAASVFANLSNAAGNAGEAAGDTYNSIESLTGSNFDDTLTGSSGANSIIGGGGNDVVTGLGGADSLYGGDGNDTLIGGVGGDYLSGGAGSDRASYVSATSGLTANLSNSALNTGEAAGDVYNSIEYLTGSNFNDTLTGSSGANRISGSSGNDTVNGLGGGDTLFGNAGDDLLNGGLGNDILEGNAGNDIFFFDTALGASNIDTVTDFTAADDTIRLENAVFTAIAGTGTLTALQFVANATGTATSANHRIVYDTSSGYLYYDANGSAGGGSQLFAKLAPGLALTNADFLVV